MQTCFQKYFVLLQTIYSAGKSIESIAMAILYGKGLFKYEDNISKHWPEFAQNGKENVTISDVFRHQSGLGMVSNNIFIVTISVHKDFKGKKS